MLTQGGKQGWGIMLISSASVEMLKIPVTDGYQAAGRAVDANWHVLVRVRTADGIEGVGYIFQPRGELVGACGSCLMGRARWIAALVSGAVGHCCLGLPGQVARAADL